MTHTISVPLSEDSNQSNVTQQPTTETEKKVKPSASKSRRERRKRAQANARNQATEENKATAPETSAQETSLEVAAQKAGSTAPDKTPTSENKTAEKKAQAPRPRLRKGASLGRKAPMQQAGLRGTKSPEIKEPLLAKAAPSREALATEVATHTPQSAAQQEKTTPLLLSNEPTQSVPVASAPEKATEAGKASAQKQKVAKNNPPKKGPAKSKVASKSVPKLAAVSKEENSEETSREGKAKAGPSKAAKRSMYISVMQGEQVEVVLTQEGTVREYYVEMLNQAKIKGNIYKGVIHNIDANLQAAFVNYGGIKNGFLQIDEVHPEYYLVDQQPSKGKYPPIQKVLKPGQEILVQVVKEPAGTKGAFLTSYLSLAGRCLVLTPGREQIGVSRKVEDEEERQRLKALLSGLNPGPDLGVIVRTVSLGANKTSLQRDLQYLKRLWKNIYKQAPLASAPSLIHQESDLATRAVRDYLTDDVKAIYVDDAEIAKALEDTTNLMLPKRKDFIHIHTGTEHIFERYKLQKHIDQIYSREVQLPSGGRLAIDATEALTAIDINSGRIGGKSSFEDMAFRTNLEAAHMIPQQLKLRDIGGQIVIDFIEMRDRSHWREVEKALRTGMKNDRARHDIAKPSAFGLVEIVRQRLGSSAISVSTEYCPHCKGTGLRRNMESQSQQALRDLHRALAQAAQSGQHSLTWHAQLEVVLYMLNHKKEHLLQLEKQYAMTLTLQPSAE